MSGLEALGLAANLVAVIEISAKVISWCYKYSKDVKNATADIERLQREAANYKTVAEGVQGLIKGPNGGKLETSKKLLDAAVQGRFVLDQLEKTLGEKRGLKRFGLRALKWPFESDEIEKHIRDLGRSADCFNQALQVDQTTQILQIDQRAKLDRFPIAEGATTPADEDDINTCLPNTRVELQKEIWEWAESDQSSPVLWLSGSAGMGKSTISLTLARAFENVGVLGATFFFKRTQKDRSNLSKFASTIAADLAVNVPSSCPFILNTVEEIPGIFKRTLGEQLDSLILQPLAQSKNCHQPKSGQVRRVIIVIDALDECEKETDIRLLIQLLTRPKVAQVPYLKIFLTSRPELPIRLGFNLADPTTFQSLTLHDVPESTIENDILIFLKFQLSTIRDSYNASGSQVLSPDWPGSEPTLELLKMSSPLFIFAATVCRFIGDHIYGHPDSQLKEVLDLGGRGRESDLQLDGTYLSVLNRLIVGRSKKQCEALLARFHTVVGSVILLAIPLSKVALAKLLGIEQDLLGHLLDGLHSVINVPSMPDSPLRLFHLSFRDFLINADDENPFKIDQQRIHANLGSRSLIILEKSLRQNICRAEGLCTPRESIEPTKIQEHLPSEVQYSCIYWVQHFEQSGIKLEDDGQAHRFLKVHLLHWIEALSILDKAYECPHLLKTLLDLTDPDYGQVLSSFLNDARLLVLKNIVSIDVIPLQLYSSILAFSPSKSKVRAMFETTMSQNLSFQTRFESDWGECLQSFKVELSADQVAFSSCSKFMACLSPSSLQIWNIDRGECLRVIELGCKWSWSPPVFSSDASSVFLTWKDHGHTHMRRQIWDISTGETLHEGEYPNQGDLGEFASMPVLVEESGFMRYSDRDCSDDSSDNSESDCSDDSSDNSDGDCSDGSSDNFDRWIRTFSIRRGSTSEAIGRFLIDKPRTEINYVRAWKPIVDFSWNSKLIAVACGSDMREVAVWDTKSQRQISSWDLPFSPRCIALSSDSSMLAVGGESPKLKSSSLVIYQVSNGQLLTLFDGAEETVVSVTFSHNSALMASGEIYGAIYLWRTDTNECVRQFIPVGVGVCSLAFNSDSTLLLSGFDDATLMLWDITAATGASAQNIGKQTASEWGSFSPNKKLVLVSTRTSLRVSSVISGDHLWTYRGEEEIIDAEFSEDSKLLIIQLCDEDNTAQVACANTGNQRFLMQHNQKYFLTPIFSPDSKFIASIGGSNDDYSVRIWNATTGDCIQNKSLEGSENPRSFRFSPDSRLITWSTGTTATLWAIHDTTDGSRQFNQFDLGLSEATRIDGLFFSEDSRLFALAAWDGLGIIRVHHSDTGVLLLSIDIRLLGPQQLMFICDSRLLVISSWDGGLIWDIQAGMKVCERGWPSNIQLSKFETEALKLHTNFGVYDLIDTPCLNPSDYPISLHRSACGISSDGSWIMWNERNILYLPLEYRPRYRVSFYESGRSLTFGTTRGRQVLCTLSPSSSREEPLPHVRILTLGIQ